MSKVQLAQANAIHIPLPDDSVHCVITSPPFFGLRVYEGVEPSVWADGWRGCLGNEPDVDLYISHLVQVCQEIKRVLHPTGVFW
ncbi:MAG: site-specific DNA-methyltransferase, partial [Gammaproteobacteria bacterium]|nr:site-specific DNA-methyltransferase [Gammaproteobacteria bacterium]